jgi:hypothetical protein
MLFFGLNSLAQGLVIDTILPNTSFISTVDSIEDFTQSSRSVFPAIGLKGGIFIDPLSVYQPMGQLINPGLLSEQPIRFTALPLLGFAYAFGPILYKANKSISTQIKHSKRCTVSAHRIVGPWP